jgi:hypothetical protein
MLDFVKWIKDRDVSLGGIMIIIALFIWIIPVKLVITLLVIHGLIQMFWKKEETVMEKHHHHHHNNGSKKKTTRKK